MVVKAKISKLISICLVAVVITCNESDEGKPLCLKSAEGQLDCVAA
jgi:hypothetical protein